MKSINDEAITPQEMNGQLGNTHNGKEKPASAMVIGGGIGGMRAALDLADAGLKVFLTEQTPCLGGRIAQLGFMFPQHDCVLCRGTSDHGYGCTRPSISPGYIYNNQHPNLNILTNTSILDIKGQAGKFSVALRQEPRYVNPERCINCGYCADVCPIELPDEYQLGMVRRKAAYKTATRAIPDAYLIDRGPYCDSCGKCVDICPTNAIDLSDQPRLFSEEVGAIILALGFKPYDPSSLEELGYGRYKNVIDSMRYERLASRSGPTEGVIIRPSDGKEPHSIAWLQCVGSRDQENQYCSSICCMYATKEAMLAKQRLGEDTNCSVFIIDERAFNKEYSKYFEKARLKHNIQYQHCRVSAIREDPDTGDLLLQYSEPNGKLHQERFEMVVLAVGLQPPDSAMHFTHMLDLELNEFGFCRTDKFTPLATTHSGVYVCGAFSTPKEISETIIDASGAAAEVMRLLNEELNTFPYTRELPFLTTPDLPTERDISNEPVQAGIFLCSCGNTINKLLDYPSMLQQISSWPHVAVSEILDLACMPETIKHIEDTIKEKKLNRIVIGACSNRTHDPLFQRAVRMAGLNPYLMELVNIRDQCDLVHLQQPDLANRKALELIRISLGRLIPAQPIYKNQYPCIPNALIIGGGLAGMSAALTIADSGYDVSLVERTDALGGNLQNLYYVAEGYNPRRLGRDLVNRVRAHQRITTYYRTEVVQHGGHVGGFWANLRTTNPDGSITMTRIEHGVTIVATGGYESRQHTLLKMPQVITQSELEEKIIHNPKEIADLKHMVMIQCARIPGEKQYCSRVCCTNAMKNAIRLKLFNPNCQVTVLYKNIVTYGFRETFYTEARRLGVIFVRYTDEKPPEVEIKDKQVNIRVWDISLERWINLPADLVTLSTTIVPADGTASLAKILRLPLSSEGFFEEAQLKLRPMDFMREGIYLAGMAHYPKFIEESIAQALAAAARALTQLSQGTLSLGGVIAVVDPTKCVGCLTCTRTCPFGIPEVIQEEDRVGVGGLGGAAYIDPTQCQGCGTCTGECPANAIQLLNYTDNQMFLRDINGLGSWLPKTQPEKIQSGD